MPYITGIESVLWVTLTTKKTPIDLTSDQVASANKFRTYISLSQVQATLWAAHMAGVADTFGTPEAVQLAQESLQRLGLNPEAFRSYRQAADLLVLIMEALDYGTSPIFRGPSVLSTFVFDADQEDPDHAEEG
jgi:hypothetical protein